MKLSWFKPRGYAHFDAAVGESFANSITPSTVKAHSWSPLISYVKRVKRYKRLTGKTEIKERQIMYASHRDACILSRYSAELTELLDQRYKKDGLEKNVIAYRTLGKANYDFSSDAQRFATANAPCIVLCFDVTGFFDNLNHQILKERLQRVLNAKELPSDWYSVFRHVTKYSHILRSDLQAVPEFDAKIKNRPRQPLATIKQVLKSGIDIRSNKTPGVGIPQGTPISSALSNLYLLDFDAAMVDCCKKLGALYQRYSDDILIICRIDSEAVIRTRLEKEILNHRLQLNTKKTERVAFDFSKPSVIQYLGFNLSPKGAVIRSSSLARQWRKARRSIARAKKIGSEAIAKGTASKIYTKKLRRRFSPIGVKNFSSYSRRSAKSFGSTKIVRQVKRLERAADNAIRSLNLSSP